MRESMMRFSAAMPATASQAAASTSSPPQESMTRIWDGSTGSTFS